MAASGTTGATTGPDAAVPKGAPSAPTIMSDGPSPTHTFTDDPMGPPTGAGVPEGAPPQAGVPEGASSQAPRVPEGTGAASSSSGPASVLESAGQSGGARKGRWGLKSHEDYAHDLSTEGTFGDLMPHIPVTSTRGVPEGAPDAVLTHACAGLSVSKARATLLAIVTLHDSDATAQARDAPEARVPTLLAAALTRYCGRVKSAFLFNKSGRITRQVSTLAAGTWPGQKASAEVVKLTDAKSLGVALGIDHRLSALVAGDSTGWLYPKQDPNVQDAKYAKSCNFVHHLKDKNWG